MALLEALEKRSENKCELCGNTEGLSAFLIPPKVEEIAQNQIVVCQKCEAEITSQLDIDKDHWRCLNESMWNPEPAVQVVAYRMLQKLNSESWAQDALNMIYMEDSTIEWANEGLDESKVIHRDSNGNILSAGDTVSLIQDLNVKGAGFTAKRGTAVRRIRLVSDNAEHIEGKVEGQQIVILTKYVKKI